MDKKGEQCYFSFIFQKNDGNLAE